MTIPAKSQDGFTLVELLIAMAVFSFMLLIVSAGFLTVVRIQQAGIASRATQQNARNIVDQVVRDIRTSTSVSVSGTGATQKLCLTTGPQMVEYAVDGSGDLRRGGVVPKSTCTTPADGSWSKVNDDNVFIPAFIVTSTGSLPGSLGTATVTVSVASRDDVGDVLVGSNHDVTCKPGPVTQFCATTTLMSAAALRGTGGTQ